jgi:hypothetical protein
VDTVSFNMGGDDMTPGNIAEDSNRNPGFGYQYVAADIEAERSAGLFGKSD